MIDQNFVLLLYLYMGFCSQSTKRSSTLSTTLYKPSCSLWGPCLLHPTFICINFIHCFRAQQTPLLPPFLLPQTNPLLTQHLVLTFLLPVPSPKSKNLPITSHTCTLSYLSPPLLTLTSPIWCMAQGRLFIWPRKARSSARVICRPATLSGLWSFMCEISDPNPGPSFHLCPNHSSPYLFYFDLVPQCSHNCPGYRESFQI